MSMSITAARLLTLDVTEELGRDKNSANRVYRTIRGRTIKVRTAEVVPSPIYGQRLFLMTGSDCDETGAAMLDDTGHRIGPLHQVSIRTSVNGEGDLETDLEVQRIAHVLRTERATSIYEAPRPPGVVTVPMITGAKK